MNDTLRYAWLAVFVVLGSWWQFNEFRYWRAVRRDRPRPFSKFDGRDGHPEARLLGAPRRRRPFILRIRVRRSW